MKKVYFYFLAFIVMGFLGCEPKNSVEGEGGTGGDTTEEQGNVDDPTQNPPTPEMTADEQKEYLVSVGTDLTKLFNTADQRELLNLANDLYTKYEYYRWSSIFDDLGEDLEARYRNLFSAPKRLASIANGRTLPSASDYIIFSFGNDALRFEMDDVNQRIIVSKSSDGACYIIFHDSNNSKCEVKVWGEGSETTHSYTFIEGGQTKTIGAKIPDKVRMTFKNGSSVLMDATMAFATNERDYVKSSMDVRVANINWKYDIMVTTRNASTAFAIKYGSTNLVSATLNLPKFNAIAKDANTDWEDWLELYEDRYMDVLNTVGSAEGLVNIMDKVQVKGKASDVAAMVNAYSDWQNKYNGYNENTGISDDETLEAQEEFCKLYEKYMEAALYYNSSTKQALLKLVPIARDGYRYDPWTYDYIPYTYYTTNYVLYFPKDDTSYSFEDYFTASKFNALVDMAEDLINTYLDALYAFHFGHIELD